MEPMACADPVFSTAQRWLCALVKHMMLATAWPFGLTVGCLGRLVLIRYWAVLAVPPRGTARAQRSRRAGRCRALQRQREQMLHGFIHLPRAWICVRFPLSSSCCGLTGRWRPGLCSCIVTRMGPSDRSRHIVPSPSDLDGLRFGWPRGKPVLLPRALCDVVQLAAIGFAA